jgi:S-DNA-T family DNA segregation ATPase FtsK/SpoIIIE
MDGRPDRFSLSGFVFRQAQTLLGFAIFLLLALAIAALATWNVADPSYSYATGNAPTNILGYSGAAFADILMQFFGLASVVALLPVVAWALALISGRRFSRIPARAAAWGLGSVLSSAVLGCFPPPLTWPIPNGIGGVIGDMILRFPALFVGAYPTGTFATAVGCIFAVPTVWMMLFASGIVGHTEEEEAEAEEENYAASRSKLRSVGDEDEEDDEGGWLAFGALTHAWYMSKARMRRLLGMGPRKRKPDDFESPYDFNDDEFGKLNEPVRAKAPAARGDRMEPSMEQRAGSQRRIVSAPSISLNDDNDDDMGFDSDMPPRPADILPDDDDNDWMMRAPARQSGGRAEPRVVPASTRPKPGARLEREQQGSFIRPEGFQLPSMHLLAEPKNVVRDSTLSADALEQNARMLEGVLEDFGVKGEIIHVRPGPVVTLYELEPAPGIKSSRVIGLADDIARSMSAIAARVAVVPGRNAIGIELPNHPRNRLSARDPRVRDFETSKAKLAMALGKTIGGEPVIADLAKMPHLLVAGTTGSGKSVAINTMILSLLYRLTPQECRLIMIDPKMLELSVYDGIPHLLTPVVTDPKKAVVALKWTVREMEERYKKMSKIGVRNIDGFNSRVEQALKGEAISRTVQTGFDRQPARRCTRPKSST